MKPPEDLQTVMWRYNAKATWTKGHYRIPGAGQATAPGHWWTLCGLGVSLVQTDRIRDEVVVTCKTCIKAARAMRKREETIGA